jgi:hypothetical protein
MNNMANTCCHRKKFRPLFEGHYIVPGSDPAPSINYLFDAGKAYDFAGVGFFLNFRFGGGRCKSAEGKPAVFLCLDTMKTIPVISQLLLLGALSMFAQTNEPVDRVHFSVPFHELVLRLGSC